MLPQTLTGRAACIALTFGSDTMNIIRNYLARALVRLAVAAAPADKAEAIALATRPIWRPK